MPTDRSYVESGGDFGAGAGKFSFFSQVPMGGERAEEAQGGQAEAWCRLAKQRWKRTRRL